MDATRIPHAPNDPADWESAYADVSAKLDELAKRTDIFLSLGANQIIHTDTNGVLQSLTVPDNSVVISGPANTPGIAVITLGQNEIFGLKQIAAGISRTIFVDDSYVGKAGSSNYNRLKVEDGEFAGHPISGDLGAITAAQARTILGIVGVHKPDDQDKTNDDTLADDDDLVVALNANTDYAVCLVSKVISHVTPDYKFAFALPSGATLLLSSMFFTDNTTNPACRQYEVAGAAQAESVSGTGANMLHQVVGMVHVGATAGNLAYQWAQNTSDPNITRVKADSSLYVLGLTH